MPSLRSIPLGLYLHLPFCAYRCHYCSYSFETDWSPALMTRTLNAVVAEAEALRASGEADGLSWQVCTLYIGGGTPSVVPPGLLASFLHRLERALGFQTANLPEATLEANPENVTAEAVKAWAAAGLNRLSLGVQTFDTLRLAVLGRGCDGPTNHQALTLIRDLWKGRWNADLLTGLPGPPGGTPQRWIDLRDDLKALQAYEPGHISLYSLTLEDGTELTQLTEPVADQLWLRARQTLIDAGYEWYEISNFARPGHRSVHNQGYGRLDPWGGLGPGAEGTLPRRNAQGHLRPWRTRNPRLFPWLNGQRQGEWVSAPEFALEHYLTGWRTSDGVVPGRLALLFGKTLKKECDFLDSGSRLALNRFLTQLEGLEGAEFQRDWPVERE